MSMVSVSGVVVAGSAGQGEAMVALWMACSVSVSLAKGKCLTHVLQIPALQRLLG
jgi:hypothetical protein